MRPCVGDKRETHVKACGPEHPEWNASPETKAKSCGPGMQPFERSKNPIQVNLFGEQVWETSGRQAWEKTVKRAAQRMQSKNYTSVDPKQI